MIADFVRTEDWPQRLSDFLADAERRPFVWGEWDCCLFAADWVLALTGVDVAAEFRGAYADEDAALEIVRGYGGMVHMVESLLPDIPLSNPKMARRGDVCVVDSPLGEALGVCTGERIACASFDGMVLIARRKAIAAWRIG